jgi:hypothetical protein
MIATSKLALGLVLLSGCATLPDGPSVTALPGTGKSFEEFRADDHACQQYGLEQVGGLRPGHAATESVQKSAAAGTVLGAVAGAVIDGGHGAAIGAGTGLLIGSAVGADVGYASAHAVQRRYDSGYVQCMYAKGNRVPVSGRMAAPSPRGYYPPPPTSRYPPPDTYATPPPPAQWYAPPPDFYPTPPPPPRSY